jgi:ATP-binding cassette subfamily B multidrug efflux pump
VEFKEVVFSYKPGQPVLKGISLRAEPGQTIALVGPTGAGKSSVINLLARFYEPQGGQVLVDGHDITKVTQRSWRSQLGIVLQDTFLFTGTIRDNIRYGRPDATDEEVEAAARAVGAHEFIVRMEKGYDTEVNERGAKLSVGQRQLVAFARALCANPAILILDEATSNIDTYTETLIQDALKRLLKGRTSFVIAHRLSTIRSADRIYVIDGGQVVEEGTHDELLARGGRYAHLYLGQFTVLEGVQAAVAGD